MMKIADSCTLQMEWFGLDQWDVRKTVTAADERSVVQMHGDKGSMTIGFYEKDHGERRVIAIRCQQPGKDYVSTVFTVPPTIAAQPTPLETVREVCERYGADLGVGEVETKFLVQTEVPLPGPIVKGKVHKNHKGLFQSLFMITERGTALVALTFALDITEMLEDL